MAAPYQIFRWNRQLPGGASLMMIANVVRSGAGGDAQIRNHPFWALDYSFETNSEYRVGGAKRAWRRRLNRIAHLYPPNTPYWERYSRTKISAHSAYICFWRGEDANLDSLIRPPARYARFEDPSGRIGDQLLKGFQCAQARGEEAFWEVQALLFRIVGILMEARHEGEETYRIDSDGVRPEREDEFVRAVRKYLVRRLDEKVTLDRIARAFHVSRSTLTHKYGAETGEGPLATHMKLRIESAKQQLLLGEPLKAIAPRLGFGDIYHLSKAFKKVTGLPPRDFLNAIRKS